MLIHRCDMSHLYVWHEWCVCVMCVTPMMHVCDTNDVCVWCVWHQWCMCVTPMMHLCGTNNACVWDQWCISVTCLVDITTWLTHPPWYKSHDSHTHIHFSDMTHIQFTDGLRTHWVESQRFLWLSYYVCLCPCLGPGSSLGPCVFRSHSFDLGPSCCLTRSFHFLLSLSLSLHFHTEIFLPYL